MWGGAIQRILDEDRPTLKAINPRTWILQTDYLELDFHPSLRSFIRQRSQLLKTLKSAAPADWARTATITGAGNPLTRSVLFYAQWMAEHERPHIKQIERIVDRVRG
jgi:hypothetical protein